ncbi:MAG: phosphatidylglycerophosphatase A [Prevotella sp.]|nr:phosphatidylglycerophosphatase A [Prevotella sp.]
MKQPPLIPTVIATGFGSGFCPMAPGTAGALLATAIWIVYAALLPAEACLCVTLVLTLLFTWTGVWATDKVIPFWGEDPKRVVVDEMVGVWIPLMAVQDGEWWYVLAAFILFRFFDIVKPLGIRRMERLPRGFGVMADDILAGIYSLLIIMITRWIL